jgi:tetratricopeptide (TPR) repeat protein
MRDGEYSNAFTFFSRAAIANAEHDRARIGKILAKTKQGGKYDVLAQEIAEILQESAEKLSPADRVFAEYTSAEIALAQGDLDNARKFVESALGHDAKDARLHYLKGHLLAAADKLDEALKSFDQSVELDPYTAAYYFDVAELLRDKGRPSDAVAKLRLYGNKNFQSDEYKKRLGMALVDKGDYTEAEQIFKKMLEVSEYDADALYGLGYCYEMQQKWDEARTNYGTADQYRQGWGDPWYRMGYVAIGEKDYATARDYFDKAIEKYTRVNAPRKQLGRVYLGVATAWEKDGKKRQAESAREKAEKLMR